MKKDAWYRFEHRGKREVNAILIVYLNTRHDSYLPFVAIPNEYDSSWYQIENKSFAPYELLIHSSIFWSTAPPA